MTFTTESVASILELELTSIIKLWMQRVDKVPLLSEIFLSYQERSGHLPRLLEDLITRLRLGRNEENADIAAAHEHGKVRIRAGLFHSDAGRRVPAAARQYL